MIRKRNVVAAFAFGVLITGMSWLLWAENQPPREVTPHDPVIVTQTKIEEKRVEVPVSSRECNTYLDAVTKLREGQGELSRARGKMRNMISQIELNLMSKDSNTVVKMSRDMYNLENETNKAWLKIGDASTLIDSYMPGEGPCR